MHQGSRGGAQSAAHGRCFVHRAPGGVLNPLRMADVSCMVGPGSDFRAPGGVLNPLRMADVSCMVGPGSDAYRNLGWGNGPFLVLWGHVGAQNWISGVPNWISGVPKYMFWNSRSRFSNAFLLKKEFSAPIMMKTDSDHGAFRPCCVQT